MASPTSALSFADGARSFSLRRSASGPGLAYRRAVPSRACGGALFLLPSRWLSKHLPSVMPPVMRLHLIGAVFCDGRGQIGLTHRRSCAFDGRAVACLSYSPFRWLTAPLSGVALTSTCILFAALRACWSRRSQVDVRARRALSGAGDRPSSRRSVPAARWRLPLALLLRRGSG